MSRTGENIYKRKDGRWEARYIKRRTPGEKTTYGYLYAKSYKEVKAKLQQRLADAAAGSPDRSTSRTGSINPVFFGCVAQEWYLSVVPRVKESTQNKYRNMLDTHIIPALGGYPIEDITCETLESCRNQLLTAGGRSHTGLAPKTVSDILSIIKCILRYAAKKGVHLHCEAETVQIKGCLKEMRVLSRGEQDRLCQYLYADSSAGNFGILVALFTGIRVGELCALRWEDISLQEQTIRVHQTMQRIQNRSGGARKTKVVITPPKSASSVRTIPIPAHLAKMMETYKTVDTGFFLTNSTERYIEPRTMQNRFKLTLKRCAISTANFHALRHTFATRCIEVGFDVKSLSEILGHASVGITMSRYVHPSLELKKENMQRLAALFPVD